MPSSPDHLSRRTVLKMTAANLGSLAFGPALLEAADAAQPFGAEFPSLDSLATGEWWSKGAAVAAGDGKGRKKGKGKGGKLRAKRANPRPGGFLRNQPALTSSCCPSLTSSIGRTELISSKVPAMTESRSWSRVRIGLL
jgi:hypothetical protein